MAHPLRLLCCCCGVDGERLSGCFNQPTVAQVPLVLYRVYGDALQRDDVLLVVLFLLDDDVAVHQDVVEEEELSGFGSFAAQLCENALSDQHSTWDGQRLTCCAKACFHDPDALRVGLTVRQAVHHLSDAWEREKEEVTKGAGTETEYHGSDNISTHKREYHTDFKKEHLWFIKS